MAEPRVEHNAIEDFAAIGIAHQPGCALPESRVIPSIDCEFDGAGNRHGKQRGKNNAPQKRSEHHYRKLQARIFKTAPLKSSQAKSTKSCCRKTSEPATTRCSRLIFLQ